MSNHRRTKSSSKASTTPPLASSGHRRIVSAEAHDFTPDQFYSPPPAPPQGFFRSISAAPVVRRPKGHSRSVPHTFIDLDSLYGASKDDRCIDKATKPEGRLFGTFSRKSKNGHKRSASSSALLREEYVVPQVDRSKSSSCLTSTAEEKRWVLLEELEEEIESIQSLYGRHITELERVHAGNTFLKVWIDAIWDPQRGQQKPLVQVELQIQCCMYKHAIGILVKEWEEMSTSAPVEPTTEEDSTPLRTPKSLFNYTIHRVLFSQWRWIRTVKDNIYQQLDPITNKAPRHADLLPYLHYLNSTYPTPMTLIPQLSDTEGNPKPFFIYFEKLLLLQKPFKELSHSIHCITSYILDQIEERHEKVDAAKSDSTSILRIRKLHHILSPFVQKFMRVFSVPQSLLQTVTILLEHLLYAQISIGCYLIEVDPEKEEVSKNICSRLDAEDVVWRTKQLVTREKSLIDMGLSPSSVPDPELLERLSKPCMNLFPESVAAFSAATALIPSRAIHDIMRGVEKAHDELAALLSMNRKEVSADCVLPTFVYILSNATLPYVHALLHFVEQAAVQRSSIGCEAAYYVACLRTAVSYIMQYEPEETVEGLSPE